MKRRNVFSVLARLRAIDEKIARTQLATAHDARRRARERLDEFKAEYRGQVPAEQRLSAAQLLSLHMRGIRSAELIDEAAAEVERTTEVLTARTDRWRSSAADLEAAERLEARVKDKHAGEARRAAERALDDLFAMIQSAEESER